MVKKYSPSFIFFLLFQAVVFTSCQELTPPLVIPCYGHVDSISYHFDSLGFRENSSYANITDAWVYLDNNPVGTFQMPCTFPMIASNGVHTITIYPGIIEDGIADMRTKYPYYTYYTVNVTLTQNQIVKFSPSVTYTSFAKFVWTENFETGISISSTNVASDTSMFRNNSPSAFQGNWEGAVILDSTNPTNYKTYYTGYGPTDSLIKNGSTQVYLEINYKSNTLFSVGLYETAGGDPYIPVAAIVYVLPSNGIWKKMYISLEETIADNPNGEPFTIYFQMQRPAGDTLSYLYLDNIKLVE